MFAQSSCKSCDPDADAVDSVRPQTCLEVEMVVGRLCCSAHADAYADAGNEQMLRRLGLLGLQSDTRLITLQPRNVAEALDCIMQVRHCTNASCVRDPSALISWQRMKTAAPPVPLHCAIQIGYAAGAFADAAALVERSRSRLRAVATAVAKERRPRVLSLEGVEPLVLGETRLLRTECYSTVVAARVITKSTVTAGGHWLPEMKELAGGADDWQTAGDAALRVTWDQVGCAGFLLLCGSRSSQAR